MSMFRIVLTEILSLESLSVEQRDLLARRPDLPDSEPFRRLQEHFTLHPGDSSSPLLVYRVSEEDGNAIHGTPHRRAKQSAPILRDRGRARSACGFLT